MLINPPFAFAGVIPEFQSADPVQYGLENRLSTLKVYVKAYPEPTVEYWFNGQQLQVCEVVVTS